MERDFASAWDEIHRIDYLLYELARAVELGELPLENYRLISARHLQRRAQLVGVVSATTVPSAVVPPVEGTATGQAEWSAQREPRVARTPRPVPWTTVLIFLGSFLVIVAAAVFALVAWKLMGTPARLAFLGSLTGAFYLAGWWVRRRLRVPVGAIALTVVGSAMLLFDGWIVIDGYKLAGPFPWAVLLLACSVVYWFTEVVVAERFFGVIGAAAQLAWWWLLGEGIGLSEPARLAGMALVVVAWRLAAEKGRDDRNVGSLALALEYAAPVTAALLAVSFVVTVGLEHGWQQLAYALVIGACGAVAVRRSRLLEVIGIKGSGPHIAAAVLQAPVLFALLEYDAPARAGSWVVVGLLFAAALAYATYGLLEAGVPFFVAALAAEASAVGTALSVLDASESATVMTYAVLAVAWSLAAWLALRPLLADGPVPHKRLRQLHLTSRIGATVLLFGCSLGAMALSEVPASPMDAIPVGDAAVAAFVLAAWACFLLLVPNRVGYAATVVFTGYTGAAIASATIGDREPALWAILPVLAVTVLLPTLRWAEERFSARFAAAMRWLIAAEVLLAALMGIGGQSTEGVVPYALSSAALALLIAVTFAIEASAAKWKPASCAAAVFAVLAAMMAGGTGPSGGTAAGLSGAAAAAAIAWVGLLADKGERSNLAMAGIAGSVAGSVVVTLAYDSPGYFATGLAMIAAAWVFGAYSWHEALIVPSGLALFSAVCALSAHVDAGGWVTLGVAGAALVAMSVPALSREFGPGGSRRVLGGGLAVAAMIGMALLLWQGAMAGSATSWLPTDEHMMAAGMAVLATVMLALSVRWRFEPGLYAGWLVVLLAVWAELSASPNAASELYTTSLAFYLVLVGIIVRRHRREPVADRVLDAAAVVIGLGLPLLWGLETGSKQAQAHAIWVISLSVVAIAAGIAVKVRWYFFGGVAAIAAIALYRSFDLLTEYWWLVLGAVGIAMLAVALTWEQQRESRGRLVASFHDWR